MKRTISLQHQADHFLFGPISKAWTAFTRLAATRNGSWAALPLMLGLLPCTARSSGPTITSVSSIAPQQTQTITITGTGFGTLSPYTGDSAYIQIVDTTKPFSAGHTGDNPDDFVTLSIASWTDTQVVVSGFAGDYGAYNWTLQDGDQITINVWNAQTGAGAGSCSTAVGAAASECGGCGSIISSETLATVPGIDSTTRTRIGIGESVKLTSCESATWTIKSTPESVALSSSLTATTGFPPSAGFPSDECSNVTSSEVYGTQACFTAPFSNATITVTATFADGSSASKTFTIVQPTGLIFQRMKSPPLESPGYRFFDFPPLGYLIGMVSEAFLTPGDVSFVNTRLSEYDTPTPKFTPEYNLLFTIDSTENGASNNNAWLVGCDIDIDLNVIHDVFSKQSYWVFSDRAGGHKTQFSLVKTQTSHVSLSGDFYYSKGQIQALSSNGSFVATPSALSADLTVPRLSLISSIPLPTLAQCPGYVERSFTIVP